MRIFIVLLLSLSLFNAQAAFVNAKATGTVKAFDKTRVKVQLGNTDYWFPKKDVNDGKRVKVNQSVKVSINIEPSSQNTKTPKNTKKK